MTRAHVEGERQMARRALGSIVGLRREYEDWYRVLHRHVFPAVLDRISRSNVRNYSIFLHGSVLFSHLEYAGADYAGDMAAMAADEATREWWRLTDPMQVRLPEAADGEWWARLAVFVAHEAEGPGQGSAAPERLAFVLPRPACPPQPGTVLRGIRTLRAFGARDCLYVYVEADRPADARTIQCSLRDWFAVGSEPVPIEEVFHTDGEVSSTAAATPHAAARQNLAALALCPGIGPTPVRSDRRMG